MPSVRVTKGISIIKMQVLSQQEVWGAHTDRVLGPTSSAKAHMRGCQEMMTLVLGVGSVTAPGALSIEAGSYQPLGGLRLELLLDGKTCGPLVDRGTSAVVSLLQAVTE